MKTKKVQKIKMQTVEIKVAANPEDRQGMRGLKGLVFDRFAQSFAKTKDLTKLPGMDEMTAEVGKMYPQSRWMARPKVHYSYYKSKFISAQKAS